MEPMFRRQIRRPRPFVKTCREKKRGRRLVCHTTVLFLHRIEDDKHEKAVFIPIEEAARSEKLVWASEKTPEFSKR